MSCYFKQKGLFLNNFAHLDNPTGVLRASKKIQETKGDQKMNRLKKTVIWSIIGFVTILILLAITTCQAEETNAKLQRPVVIDSILFNPDGSIMWLDTYINGIRPNIQKWLREKTYVKHVKRIQIEANFLLVGAGKNEEEIKTRVRNNDSLDELFKRAFCTEVEYLEGNGRKICKTVCIGNPEDYIYIAVRLIPDSPMRNCKFLFSYIEKGVAYELGCRDEDVVEYVLKKSAAR